jgi:hypothetical protein
MMQGAAGARLGGSIVPLLLAAPAAFRSPQAVKTLGDALTEAEPHLAAATANKARNDTAMGMSTLFSHGMPEGSGLQGVVSDVRASPQGGPIREVLSAEHARAQDLARRIIESQSPNDLTIPRASVVYKAGSSVVPKAAEAITDSTRPVYTAAKSEYIPVADIRDALMAESKAQQWGGRSVEAPIKDALEQLDRMAAAQKAANPAIPDGVVSGNSVGALAKTIRVTGRGDTTLESFPYDRTAQILTEQAHKAPSQAIADTAYGLQKEAVQAPLEEGIVGQSFPQVSPTGAETKSWDSMTRILSDAKTHPDDVSELAQQLAKTGDTEAFPDLVKYGFMKAGNPASGGAVSPGTFFQRIAGGTNSLNDVQRAAFLEKIKQVHMAHGATADAADEAAQGAANLADAVQQVETGGNAVGRGRVPDMGTQENSGSNFASTMLKGSPGRMMSEWFMGNKLEKLLSARTFKQIAESLTAPDAVDRLRSIAAYSPVDNAAEVITRGLGSIGTQQEMQPDSNSPGITQQ